MSKILYKIFFILFLIIIFSGFYIINNENYYKIKENKLKLIENGENNGGSLLINKNYIKFTNFGFSKLYSDLIWLDTIQYIGENISNNKYKKYLFSRIESINTLDPYFEKPYIVGILLSLNNDNNIDENVKKGIVIGEDGINNLCDKKLINEIKNSNENYLFMNKYVGICNNGKIPHLLGNIYFLYLKDYKNALFYYKLAYLSYDDNLKKGILSLIGYLEEKGNKKLGSIIYFDLAYNFDLNGNCGKLANLYKDILLNNYYGENSIKLIKESFNKYLKDNNITINKDSNNYYENQCLGNIKYGLKLIE